MVQREHPLSTVQGEARGCEWTEDAVSWFRDDARSSINKLRRLIAILRKHGSTVRTLRAEDPGRIVYADEYQVVAETPEDT
jgi:hypothetical protein